MYVLYLCVGFNCTCEEGWTWDGAGTIADYAFRCTTRICDGPGTCARRTVVRFYIDNRNVYFKQNFYVRGKRIFMLDYDNNYCLKPTGYTNLRM